MAQKRLLKMHPNLLLQTIQRQAGTLTKAITEGVMNSIEAGADSCEVTIDREAVLIEDNGRGFQSLREIEQWFETFGTPHEKSEGKIWANFRIGRGQMFSFGRNVWRTKKFVMDVDFKKAAASSDELMYDLHQARDDEAFDGCQILIELYDQLSPSELERTINELAKLVRWVHKPVFINGVQVNRDVGKTKFDYEDVDCCLKLRKTGGLAVYNLGVFVREYPGHYFGCGGDVISKHQLKLNQARSDVLVNECLIWKNVKKQIDKFIDHKLIKTKREVLTADERQRLADRLIADEISENKVLLKLFTDCTGRNYDWDQLCRTACRYPKYSEGDRYNRIADKIHQHKLAFVFATETLERFGCSTAKELMDKMHEVMPENWTIRSWQYWPLKNLSAQFREGYTVVEPKQTTAKEQLVLTLCEKTHGAIIGSLRAFSGVKLTPRKFMIGISDAADGWTDGSSYIVLSRNWIDRRDFTNVTELYELGNLLLHEYCHQDDDQCSHTHSPEFYQAYHDASDGVGKFIQAALSWIPELYRRQKKKLSVKLTKQLDRLDYAQRHAKTSQEVVQLDQKVKSLCDAS